MLRVASRLIPPDEAHGYFRLKAGTMTSFYSRLLSLTIEFVR